MPRKKIQVDADQVRELARLGCTWDEIAGVLSIARTTFVMRMKEKKFREAYDRGIAEGNASLRRAQYDGAVGGNTGLLVWLGAAIGGGVALSAASPEALWPTAFVAAAYILGQAIVDTWGE